MFLCVFTLEDKVWTTVMNNLPPKTPVTGSSRERRTVLQVNYSASMEQVRTLISDYIQLYTFSAVQEHEHWNNSAPLVL